MKYAVIGAGHMGRVVATQLPKDAQRLIVDTDLSAAERLAAETGAAASSTLADAADADLIAIVVPAHAVEPVVRALAACAKGGSVLMNMSTNGLIPPELPTAHPELHFVNSKIIGEAAAILGGAPTYVLTDATEPALFARVQQALPGYTKVLQADPALVGRINTAATEEGIRAAVNVRKALADLDLPSDWVNIAISTVCAGSMRAYAEGRLGDFGNRLAEQLEGN